VAGGATEAGAATVDVVAVRLAPLAKRLKLLLQVRVTGRASVQILCLRLPGAAQRGLLKRQR
jgi:hypothetical protein